MLQRILGKFGYVLHKQDFLDSRYLKKGELRPLDQLFHRFLHTDFFFLQIGGNDGVSHDPIYHLVTQADVKGIILEPLPDLFQQLQANYRNHTNIKCINRAIHATESIMPLYRVDPANPKYPSFTKGTPSFDKAHHQLSGIDEEDIIAEEVQCVSLQQLLEEEGIEHLDLLQIDTEGYDWQIVQMIDLDKMRPKIISFEHGVHEGIMDMETYLSSVQLLTENRYNVITQDHDLVAYDRTQF